MKNIQNQTFNKRIPLLCPKTMPINAKIYLQEPGDFVQSKGHAVDGACE